MDRFLSFKIHLFNSVLNNVFCRFVAIYKMVENIFFS